jgi:hypothetical protein
MAYQVLSQVLAMRAGSLPEPDAVVKSLRLPANSLNRAPSKHLGICLSLMVFLAGTGLCMKASAEESMLSYSMAPVRPVEISLWYAEPVTVRGFDRKGWLGDASPSTGRLRFQVPEHNWLSDRSLTLVQTRLPTRFAYDAWAKIVTSYGQFFPDNILSRSRLTGYDMLDPDWFYVKVTFKF